MPIIEKFLNNNVKSMRSFVMNSLTSKQYFLAASALVAATMLMGTAWMSDDAFITLRVIDNFVNGYGLRYNVIERVQVFTHPLWLFLLTPFYALTREAIVTTMVVSVFLSLGALWLLAARIARNIEYGCLLVLVAVASRAICHYSTSGLESPLTFLLSALFVWQLYSTERIWIPAGIAGLLWLNRLDLVVLLGPAVSYLLFHARGEDRVKVVAAAIFPALAWMIFSVIYYGAPFPNTAYAKLGTGYDSGILILHGLAYAKDFVLTNPLLALIMVMAVINAFLARLPALPNARVGHYERMLPPGYAETALSATPTTEITALIPLLNDVILATRAPLFAEGRWSAIWRLLSGKYSWVYEADLYGENK